MRESNHPWENTVSPKIENPWERLRSTDFHETGKSIITNSVPSNINIISITHVRTGHYAAYRIEAEQGTWLVRVGVSTPADNLPTDNSGFLGTATQSPTGQYREYALAKEFFIAGVSVALPSHYEVLSLAGENAVDYDVLWLPFLQDEGSHVTAVQWVETLSTLHAFLPEQTLPVFTNRAKTEARLISLVDRDLAATFEKDYNSALENLFDTATRWGTIHGDAHYENILIASGKPTLFDFDTVCWAPTVWDITHLLTRAGMGGNTGYTVDELKDAFNFNQKEVDAALQLRAVATRIARAVANSA